MRTQPTNLYVFDLDGTIANLEHRLHHILPPGRKNWPAFFEACDGDSPIDWVIHMMQLIAQSPAADMIIILSGRMETVREKTQAWLLEHNVPFDMLIMREAEDFRDDTVVKLEMLRKFMKMNPKFALRFIVDDRQRVVDMWRREGYNVLQCAAWKEVEGTYEKE